MPEGDSIQAATFEDVASNAMAELDGTATAEAAPAQASPEAADGTPAAAAPAVAEGEGGTPATAEAADFLQASGVSLEEILENVTDEAERAFITKRYKDMEGYFHQRTAEVAERDRAAQGALSENEQLKARLAALEAREPAAAPADEAKQGEAWRTSFVRGPADHDITVEEAIADPQQFAEFIRQQARANDLLILDAVDARLKVVEGFTAENVNRQSAQTLDKLFESAPEYRNQATERAMADIREANPRLTLEQAFEIVVGPRIREDTLRLGARLGEVQERKRRASVPSSGVSGTTGPELPDKPTSIDQIWEHVKATQQA